MTEDPLQNLVDAYADADTPPTEPEAPDAPPPIGGGQPTYVAPVEETRDPLAAAYDAHDRDRRRQP